MTMTRGSFSTLILFGDSYPRLRAAEPSAVLRATSGARASTHHDADCDASQLAFRARNGPATVERQTT